MNMNLGYKQGLEALGYRVIEQSYIDPHFRTNTFIEKPDGTLAAYYDDIYQIPNNLNDGDEVSTPATNIPNGAQNEQSHWLHYQEFTAGLDERGLIGPLGIILIFIIIGIVVGVLFAHAIWGNQYNPPPCGERGSVTQISECVKEVVYPDCSGVMFDTCTDSILDSFDPPVPPPDWTEGLKWIAIGAVAVAGLYVAAKVLPGLLQKKPKYPQYSPPQQYPSYDNSNVTYSY